MHEEDSESKDPIAFCASGDSFKHEDTNGCLDLLLNHNYSPFINIRETSFILWIFMQERNPTCLLLRIIKFIPHIAIFYNQVLRLLIVSLGPL